MTKVALIFGCSALTYLLVMGAYPTSLGALSGPLDIETSDQSLLVKIKKDKKNDDNDDQDDNDDDKPKAKSKPFNCKKAKCDPGEVKLDKPNIYGACCQETAAPLTPKPKEAEPEKCKFPGEVGTPPNCTCPSGTEFMGYKGCVKKVVQRVCCTGIHGNTSGKTGPSCRDTEAAARQSISEALINGVPVTSITCAPEKTLR